MNFSGISNQNILGKILRLPLRIIPDHMPLPILQGPLRGKRWVAKAGTHGQWLGSYEWEKQQLFISTIRKGDVVLDIGAHVGFYTLLGSVLVGPTGRIIAFEPLPRNLVYLHQHIELNHLLNVDVVEAAVADAPGERLFEEGLASFTGRLASGGGGVRMPVVNIDTLFEEGKIPCPQIIKIDVEGAEVAVLQGAKRLLSERKPIIFLATHGKLLHATCCGLLEEIGYAYQLLGDDELIATMRT